MGGKQREKLRADEAKNPRRWIDGELTLLKDSDLSPEQRTEVAAVLRENHRVGMADRRAELEAEREGRRS
jgi:hypothetical protein